MTDNLNARALAGDNLRAQIIANFGVGFSPIDITTAKQQNIAITNTPDVLSDCTADLAMTLLLTAARRAGEGERELRDAQWSGWRPTHMIGAKVTGKTLGIIGFSRIGRAMAKRAHHGFGMRIKVYNRSRVAADLLSVVQAEQMQSLDELAWIIHGVAGLSRRDLVSQGILFLRQIVCLIFAKEKIRCGIKDQARCRQSVTIQPVGGGQFTKIFCR